MGNEEAVLDDDLDLDAELGTDGGDSITVRELSERVSVIEPGIVLMREIEKPTPATLRCLFAAVNRLSADFERFGVVVDLLEGGGAASAEYRRFVPKCFSDVHAQHGERLKLIAVASTGSLPNRVATKFVIGRMTQVPLALEKSREHAVAAVRKALTDS